MRRVRRAIARRNNEATRKKYELHPLMVVVHGTGEVRVLPVTQQH